MDKKTAIELLGGTPAKAAQAMSYKSVHAIYMWPEVLPQATADKVNGAMQRMKALGKRGARTSQTQTELNTKEVQGA
jgi:hypothetical protein